jgi:hypothetical protein
MSVMEGSALRELPEGEQMELIYKALKGNTAVDREWYTDDEIMFLANYDCKHRIVFDLNQTLDSLYGLERQKRIVSRYGTKADQKGEGRLLFSIV